VTNGKICALFALIALSSNACSDVVNNDNKLQAMLLTGQTNKYHNAEIMDRVLTAYLEETGLFDVTVVRSPATGEDMSLFAPVFSDFDVVVSNYDGDAWPEATKSAFVSYMRGGGGLVTVHSTDNAFHDWPEWLEMTALGGWGDMDRGIIRDENWGPAVRWVDDGPELYDGPGKAFHPPPHDFVVTSRATEHPVMRGLPSEWLHAHDELYSMLRGPAQNMHVLATGFADPDAERASGYHEPAIFTVSYGEGRVFHTTLGHIPDEATEPTEAVRCIGFVTTIQRGAEWAATGDVTQPAPEVFPDATSTKLKN